VEPRGRRVGGVGDRGRGVAAKESHRAGSVYHSVRDPERGGAQAT
jgi:hypothetical protein